MAPEELLSEYLPIFVFLVIAGGLSVAMVAASLIVAVCPGARVTWRDTGPGATGFAPEHAAIASRLMTASVDRTFQLSPSSLARVGSGVRP